MWTISGWYEEARRGAEGNAQYVRDMADLALRLYDNSLPGVPRAQVVRRLQEWNRKRLDAVPDLKRYPELRGVRELVEAEWRGVRDGVGLSDEQWAAHCDGHFYYHRFVTAGRVEPFHCSCIFFPTSDHGPLFASNLDTSLDQPFQAPEWPACSEHLVIGGVSSGVYLDEEPPEIFPAPVMRLVGRYCRNTDEAVEMLKRYNYFWGPGNLIVVDREHRVAMIEKTACRIGVRYSPDGFGFITAMTALDPDIKAYLDDRRRASVQARNLPPENADVAYWRVQDKRASLMTELLDEARKNPTLETMQRFIQFRSPERGNVCGDGEVYFPGGPPSEYTLRTAIWLLREGKAMWWARVGDTPSFKNRMPDVQYRDVWLWD